MSNPPRRKMGQGTGRQGAEDAAKELGIKLLYDGPTEPEAAAVPARVFRHQPSVYEAGATIPA